MNPQKSASPLPKLSKVPIKVPSSPLRKLAPAPKLTAAQSSSPKVKAPSPKPKTSLKKLTIPSKLALSIDDHNLESKEKMKQPGTLTGFRDTDEVLASKMDDRELLELCKTAKFSFCTDENFWRRRTFSRFGQIEKMEGKKWKEFYLQIVYYLNKKDRYTAIENAAKYGHEDVVMYIVSDAEKNSNWQKNRLNATLEPGLKGAAIGGNQKLVDFFISKGANDWDIAIGYAILGGHPKLVKFFLKQGARINGYKFSYKAGLSGNKEIVVILIENQVADWYQILLGATEGGHKNLIDLAIKNLKKKNIVWDDVMTAAARGGHLDLIKTSIKEGANNWDRGLKEAAQRGNLDIFLFFVGKKAKDFAGALEMAVSANEIEMVKYILENYPLDEEDLEYAKKFINDNKEILKLLKNKLKQLKIQ